MRPPPCRGLPPGVLEATRLRKVRRMDPGGGNQRRPAGGKGRGVREAGGGGGGTSGGGDGSQEAGDGKGVNEG
jgi:hypothetical protein